ncbi:peptidoglycan-binding domain-containing protein [Granulosicoccus antarcticus]|uniref:Peptidoglycan binding-like domain-containing protein n=1 Tax=Granulosicoccus antarcticus IMCC3135 TaxID=1192854 RepID=A0A2Z2NK67_9GAMM|nr:peptidoglycan-binding domain-containing protein [Granulosicoccus antarcticus]ASJ70401.1 hypothetical protein IMCC3135_01410 [Granulosicoccus antarcticus IMCC3135]
MLKKSSLLGKEAGRYLLIASMTGLMVGCGGGSSSDTNPEGTDPDLIPGAEIPLGEQDFDFDGILNADDEDADGDGLNDFTDDNFVDLDEDGLDDFSLLTEAQIEAETVLPVSAQNPCGSQGGTDNNSSNDAWSDNCVVRRSTTAGGQFADSLFSAGIQRVLYCSGFATDADYAGDNDYTNFADGEYGPASEAAIERFQEEELLVADGVVGRQTWARLDERVELLNPGVLNETPDTYGFRNGVCAGIPMFYQDVSTFDGGLTIVGGQWTLARNQPNEDESVPFSYEAPFNEL